MVVLLLLVYRLAFVSVAAVYVSLLCAAQSTTMQNAACIEMQAAFCYGNRWLRGIAFTRPDSEESFHGVVLSSATSTALSVTRKKG
jgi:hypothetical protein